jgi:hypothetical protein
MNDLHSDESLPARVSTEAMRRLLAAELSLPARLAHVGLLLAALGVGTAVASLWATEPALPARTQIAFAAIVAVGLAWASYATWVLRRRRVLLAGHRVVAARMAVTFCTLFVTGALALGLWGPPARAPYAAAATGTVLLAVAIVLQGRAHRQLVRLRARCRELEARLAGAA